jgi:two-component system response regulator
VQSILEAVNQALTDPAIRQIGPDVLRVLVRRALARVPGVPPPPADGYLLPHGLGLDPRRLESTLHPGEILPFLAALETELSRVLGAGVVSPVWDAVVCSGQPDAASLAPGALPSAAFAGSAVPTLAQHEGAEPHQLRAILLVEDNPADVQIAQRALRETGSGVELIVVRDGQEAVDYLLRQGQHAQSENWRNPDLILLDLHLPRLGGREVLERIRGTPELRTVPVIVMTTSTLPEDIRQMYAAGANTYFEKPQDFGKYLDVLRTIQTYWLDAARLPPSLG